VPANLPDNLAGYSKALYSTWLQYKPDRLLIDCGEGCATALGNNGFAIEKLFLTHGHIDHIGGVPPLLWARASAMGDTRKALAIYFPAGDALVEDLISYMTKSRNKLPYSLEWIPCQAGDRVPLRGQRVMESFATRHVKRGLTLGYKVTEARRRLKSEFAGFTSFQLQQHSQTYGGQSLTEPYEAVICAFGGDGLPLKPEDVAGAEFLCHEATLLHEDTRKGQFHSTLTEAVAVAKSAQVRNLLLMHISGRYRAAEIEEAARAAIAGQETNFSVWCLFKERMWQINSGKGSS
jgi:ribonuclease Z